jgi:hypothetical protein
MTRDVIEQFEQDGAAIVRDALPLFSIERARSSCAIHGLHLSR